VRVRRSLGARSALFLILAVLLGAAAKLQVLEVEEYATAAKNNRLRPLMIHPPRGTIYDRHGKVVAENVPAYQVLLMPTKSCANNSGSKRCRDEMNAQIEPLVQVLGLTDAQVRYAWRKWQRQSHLPMILEDDARPEVVARLQESRAAFPGVLLFEYAKRHYPAGSAVAHIIGYVSEINETQLKDSVRYGGYTQGQWIGQQGLEKQYERHLGGAPGINYLEIDAMGRIKRWLPEELGVPPIPGKDLQLYLDLDLQRYVQGIFPRKFNGALVALDPQTGGVLAYYSHPSYDPNEFTGGISTALYDSLQNHEGKPLIDRVAGSTQPPASTWKLPVAAMALEEKVIRGDEFMPIPCTGGMTYGRYARCWEPSGHGRVDLTRGIMLSCDVYFYQVGIKLGLKRYLETGTKLGFQKRTGIDLPTEVRNIFPQDLKWWQDRMGYMPKDNEVLSMAIGQGPVTMTPLKMAHLYAAIARSDGRAPAPRLAAIAADSITVDLGISGETIEWMRKGMRRVVGPGGTAQLTRIPYWDNMGKTGTAQACARCPLRDHAWYVGMAGPPGKDPEIVAAMFLQHGEHGYTASDYVTMAMNFYLNRKYGRPFDMWTTPRQKFARGLYVDTNWLYSPVVDPIPGVGWPENAVQAREVRPAPRPAPPPTPAQPPATTTTTTTTPADTTR
jgi:penicillin-binding protein 2